MVDSQIYYARPYRGWQQHKVTDSYDLETGQHKLTALCGSKTKHWAWGYNGVPAGSYMKAEPWKRYPVCRACSALPPYPTAPRAGSQG